MLLVVIFQVDISQILSFVYDVHEFVIKIFDTIHLNIQFVVFEGDVWLMDWRVQQEWQHAVLPISKSQIDNLLHNRQKPLFELQPYMSGTIVGRSPKLDKQLLDFTGNEQIFIPNGNLNNTFIHKFPKSTSTIGPPTIHKTSILSNEIPLPIGSIHTREYLFNERFHLNQKSALCSHGNIACSIIFGKMDVFEPSVRLWNSNNNPKYENAMKRAGLFSTSIRVFINLNKCNHLLDTSKTTKTKKLHWNNKWNCSSEKSKTHMLYVGQMYVTSYVYKNSEIYFQMAENPAPRSWREYIFSVHDRKKE